jgi:polysaccharide export outer membrane protein
MTKIVSLPLLLLSLAFAVSAASAQLAPPISTSKALLRPGDALQIEVWHRAEFTGEFAVASNGTIAHPLLGEITVAGLPMEEINRRVYVFLQEFDEEPHFVIQPLVRVGVGGEVRTPNLLKLSPDVTIAEAIAAAGGATQYGKLNKVKLIRSGREMTIDVTRAEPGPAQQPVQSGDQLYVPRKGNFFRDNIAPAGSIVAALVGVANLIF